MSMIKLTLKPYTQPITYIFEKKSVIFGKISATGLLPDLALSQADAEDIHIKIELNGHHFIAFNIAGDPFTTLNELPFSKKTLQNGDLLQIKNSLFLFEGKVPLEKEETSYSEENSQTEDSFLVDVLTHKMESTDHLAPHPTDTQCSSEPFDLDAAMRDLEEMLAEKSIIEIEELETEPTQSTNTHSISHVRDPIKQQNLTTKKSQLSKIEVEALLLEVSLLENELKTVEKKMSETKEAPDKELIPQTQPASTALVTELSILETPLTAPTAETLPTAPQLLERKRSMKDDSNNESEEDDPSTSKKTLLPSSSIINWKSFLIAFAAFTLLILIVISCLYIAIIDRNDDEEIKAAEAIADVAMGLNFAQINHVNPQNQNWSDPDFLKHNLNAVLAFSYTPLAIVDAHGNFQNTPYILRIYTGKDLNHFLIIAQPRPSLLQWLKPKAAITVDSSFMELRKITDLKTLNRLLINPTLDTSNSTNIANLVNLGELIPLMELKEHHPHTGFDLPKALAYIQPGAENFIYNATRYYPLGESLMKKAIALYESDDNGQDLNPLIDEIKRFSRFPHIVLYSSAGIQMAEKGQKALSTFLPSYKFIHAYLQLNTQNLTRNSHLLMDKGHENSTTSNTIAEAPKPEIKVEEKLATITENVDFLDSETSSEELLEFLEALYREANEKASKTIEMEDLSSISKNTFSNENTIDPKHPLYYKMVALYKTREQTLKPIREKIDKEKTQRHLDNSKKLIALKVEYELAAENWLTKNIKLISELQQEYATMPLVQFMEYAKAVGMETFIDEHLQKQLQDPTHIPFSRDLMRSQINLIKKAASLKDLDTYLSNISELLTLDNFPDPLLFIAYQNEIHSTTVHKLDKFLLSPTTSLPSNELNEKNRTTISHILKTAWVTDEGESDYYLDEFNLLLSKKSLLEQKEAQERKKE